MAVHTISVYVENHSGALSRIAGLFSSRGYNITSLSVAETEDPSVSRMTIIVNGDEEILEQVVKQLNRLIDVIKVVDFQKSQIVDRELLLLRVDAKKASRLELINLAGVFGAKAASISANSILFELTETSEKIEDFLNLMKPYGIKETVRTGKIAIAKK